MAVHQHSVRVPGPGNHIPLACNGVHAAMSLQRTGIGVWYLQDLAAKPLELRGHRQPVAALCFNQRPLVTLLCSCAEDYIIVWNVEKVQAAVEAGHPVRGQIIGTCLGYVQYCSFNHDDTQVAVCVERKVHILDAKIERVISTLDGHTSTVTCAEFCPHYSATLVTAGEDRTFKVWDLSEEVVVYRSTIISSAPFISLSMNPAHESFALGTTDGQIRVYDLTDGNGFRLLQHLDVEKLVSKLRSSNRKDDTMKNGPSVISSRPSWQRQDGGQSNMSPDLEEDNTEIGCSVLSLIFTLPSGQSRAPTPAKLSFLQQDQTIVSDLLGRPAMLVIATTAAIIQVNARTLEPCTYTNLQEPVPSCSMLEDSSKLIPLVQSAVLAQSAFGDEVWCLTSGLFVSEISMLSVNVPTDVDMTNLQVQLATARLSVCHSDSAINELAEVMAEVTVLSSAPLVENSLLKAELVLKVKEKKKSKGAAAGRRASTGAVDKPLVFHDKVKSSGYTAPPRRSMFQPQTNGFKVPSATRRASHTPPSPFKMAAKEYPMTCQPPTKVKVKLDIAERPTAANTVRFSGDGQLLACALVNTSTQVFRMPLTGKGWTFTGQNGSVTSANWSHDNKYLVTSCEDKTAALWSLGLSDPVMTLTHVNSNFGSDKEGGLKSTKENPSFGRPVHFAQFYYMDKFLLLTHGNTFSLYKYHVDTTKSDIKRYLSNNRYKLVKSLQMAQAQQITAFSAINSFYSYIAICAGSDKSVEVFDLNVGQSIRTMMDTHTKPLHTICQNKGSVFVSHPASAYDLFVTAAASDCIKLWDLRSNRCVRRYEGHTNRIYPCGAAISPCSRFIATGSEDRCAYIFDIRSGTYLHKLTGHTDTVGDVAYHPLYAQLVTASVDGKLRLFAES